MITDSLKGGRMNTHVPEYQQIVVAPHEPPCLTIYQVTHRSHPENQQDPIRYRNQLKVLESSLRRKYPERNITGLMEPMYDLCEDNAFWNHTLDGLAVFRSGDTFKVFRLQEPVREFTVVADSFHTKPLLRVLQSHQRYQLLSLSRSGLRLFEGTRESLDEITPASGVPKTMQEALGAETEEPYRVTGPYGGTRGPGITFGKGSRKEQVEVDAERYFRVVDKAIYEHHTKPSGLPLLLAALPENQGLFRQLTQNPLLMPEGIEINPDALKSGDLHAKAWGIVMPHITADLTRLVVEYDEARAKGLGSSDLESVAKAAAEGRVAYLFLDADVQIPGRVDPLNGAIMIDELTDPEVDDVLDDIGELVLGKGGNVKVIPSAEMPASTGVAATFRF